MSRLTDSCGHLLAHQPPFLRSHFFGLINTEGPKGHQATSCPPSGPAAQDSGGWLGSWNPEHYSYLCSKMFCSCSGSSAPPEPSKSQRGLSPRKGMCVNMGVEPKNVELKTPTLEDAPENTTPASVTLCACPGVACLGATP